MNQIATTERNPMNSVAMSAGPSGSSIAPQSLGDVVRFAEVMCRADIALPQHLRGNAGACMAVAMQALEWQMSPFAVASKSYSVGGRIAYEAQLIAAVVNTRSGIKGRLKYEFEGEGPTLTCRVVGVLDGEECEYKSPPVGSITTKNSPLWKSDPQQQLGYFSARSWARRHCPEVILGVYDREEVEQLRGSETAKDVTPLSERLAMAKIEQHEPAGAQEGFDRSFVARETLEATSEPAIEQEPSSPAVPPVDDVGSGDSSPPVPAADESEMQPPAGEKIRATQDGSMGTTSTTGQSPVGVVPTESVSSSQAADLKLSDEDRAWLKTITRMLWAATAVGEQDLLKNTYQGARENQTPPGISKAARDRGNSIYLKCKLVCFGEKDAGETLEAIALVACVEPREIVS